MRDPIKTQVNRTEVGIPSRPFLYTLDQVAGLTSTPLKRLKTEYIHFEAADAGIAPKDRMKAHNIGSEMVPDWRIGEKELIRWLRRKGFRVYEERVWE